MRIHCGISGSLFLLQKGERLKNPILQPFNRGEKQALFRLNPFGVNIAVIYIIKDVLTRIK